MGGKVKATLLETQFLGLNLQGVRRLIETRAEKDTEGSMIALCTLFLLLAGKTPRERNERAPKPPDLYGRWLNGDSLHQDAQLNEL
jgi:hypothetical protein